MVTVRSLLTCWSAPCPCAALLSISRESLKVTWQLFKRTGLVYLIEMLEHVSSISRFTDTPLFPIRRPTSVFGMRNRSSIGGLQRPPL